MKATEQYFAVFTSYKPNTRAVLGEYCLRTFWYGPSEARSVQERVGAIFSQKGLELVRVNKKIAIWQCLTLYYLKSEPWRIGMNETVYRIAFKTQQFYSTKKFISHKKNCLFSSSFKSLQLF